MARRVSAAPVRAVKRVARAVPAVMAQVRVVPVVRYAMAQARAVLVVRAARVQRPVVLAHLRSIRSRRPDATPQQLVAILERRYLTAVTAGGAAVGGGAASSARCGSSHTR